MSHLISCLGSSFRRELNDLREAVLDLLRFADIGINNVKVLPSPNKSDPDLSRELPVRPEIQLIHTAGGESYALDFSQESQGTKTWFNLIAPLLDVLAEGQILLFDELDASLHPQLTEKIVDLFYDVRTNPNNAQLIFTTHDTHLLQKLNRDEVWLAEKNEYGATSLTALSDFSGDAVRRSMNLERNYLSGRYCGVPNLDESLLLTTHALVGNRE